MLSFRSWIFVPLGIALAQAPVIGWSATFNVTSGGDNDCSDFNCALQPALDAAQSNNQADTILLAPGNYDASGGTFFYPSNNVLAAAENFPLTLQGGDASTTILDGGTLQQVMLIDTSVLTADDNADIVVQGLTFQNGNSIGERGGGIFVHTNDADIILGDSQILNNVSDVFGGGAELDCDGAGNIRASDNIFVGNSCTADEAGADFIATDGSITVLNNIFFDNQAQGLNSIAGGAFLGFFNSSANHLVVFVNNTVFGNSAGSEGGGVWLDPAGGTANLYNNIVFGNTAGPSGGGDIFIQDAGTPINLFNNDFAEICFGSTGTCDPVVIAGLTQANNINQDPLLIDPANGDFNLGIGSLAIDAGDPAAPDLPATDFAGNPRIIGSAPDMGALEALPDIEVSPTSLTFESVASGSESTLILTIANNGAGLLEVDSLDLEDSVNYSLDPTQGSNPCGSLTPTVAGGESCTIGVIFEPAGSGTFDSILTVNSNDPDEAQVGVALTGVTGGVEISGNGACSLQTSSAGAFNWLIMMTGLIPALYLRRRK